MSMKNFVARLSELIEDGNELEYGIITELSDDESFWNLTKKFQNFVKWRASSLNLILLIAGENSPYYIDFPRTLDNYRDTYIRGRVTIGIGILRSIKEDVEKGLITELENLISADLLSSIYEQATVLLESGYKDAAAVYCRVMLETALKKICDKNNVNYPLKSTINPLAQILRNEDIINIIEWRHILSWADIGNAAAHGEFSKYDIDEVKRMMDGINDFTRKKLI